MLIKKSLIIAIVTLILSILISIVLTLITGVPIFFIAFFLPLLGLPMFTKERYYVPPVLEVKRCPNCGAVLEGWENYCPVCGYRLKVN